MQLHLRDRLHPRRPVVLQIADALLLALAADALVEVDGFSNALFERKTARSQRLRTCGCRLQWGLPAQVSGQSFSILSALTHIIPVPIGADRNLCRLVPK